MFKIIACVDSEDGIGKEGKIPWNIRSEMRHFQIMTLNNTVIMGPKTWESLSAKPLPKRQNIIISSSIIEQGCLTAPNLDEALRQATCEKTWVIGGSQLYKDAILSDKCDGLLISRLPDSYGCDSFFSEIPTRFKKIQEQAKDGWRLECYNLKDD